MNEVLEYFEELNNSDYFEKRIKVYGYKKNYKYHFVESITPYLFEELNIKNHIVKPGSYNRPGRVEEKKYITIHDTGDTTPTHGSKFWCDAVYDGVTKDDKKEYKCSYQYVVGNEGIFHMIPDNEIAFHAGDSTKVSYHMNDTGVKVAGDGVLDISKDGFFTIDGVKSNIVAPTDEEGNILANDSINDMGLELKDINGNWHLGEVYFNEGYKLIANRGGNNNSIGMEISVAQGENLTLNLQRAAKLTVKLLKENNLMMEDIKQHHFFSGKNCPQTLRENELWDYFLHLIEVEAIIDSYISDGYKISLECSSVVVNPNGTIDKLPGSIRGIEYTIKTEYNGVVDSAMFVKLM